MLRPHFAQRGLAGFRAGAAFFGVSVGLATCDGWSAGAGAGGVVASLVLVGVAIATADDRGADDSVATACGALVSFEPVLLFRLVAAVLLEDVVVIALG